MASVFRNNKSDDHGVSRQEVQAAIAKAAELRALRAALVQGSSPSCIKYGTVSPASRPSQFSAQDYPVFTPSYEDKALPGCQQIQSQSRASSECWDEHRLHGKNGQDVYNQTSITVYSPINHTALQTSPRTELKSSRRNSIGDFIPISSYNKCKPTTISTGASHIATKNRQNSIVIVPLSDSHSSIQSQSKTLGMSFSWLFPKLKKKKKKRDSSISKTESTKVSQVFKDTSLMSIESMKKALIEANESRDAALMEVAEMKSSLEELKQKLEYLESYCGELKKALRHTRQVKNTIPSGKPRNHQLGNFVEQLLPVSDEVMVEGFLQIVGEARLSVKGFCKILSTQIEEIDIALMENLNNLFQPNKLAANLKHSKSVLYQLEALINRSLYQDFENCAFHKNGTPEHLDPQQSREAQFSSFVSLRNLSWNEVLKKGTKYYSEEFSKFCDEKMNVIVSTLGWIREWPEQLLHSFFVAAKCIWLLHLLAFSFNPPLAILRVGENRSFDPRYMEEILMDRQRSRGPSRVTIMVVPGFYVQDRVLKCKVLCTYKLLC